MVTIQNLADRRLNVDVFLTQLSLGIAADQDFIGDLLLPPLKQGLSSALIKKFGGEGFYLIDDATGDESEPKRISIALDKLRVDVEGHALAGTVNVRELKESQGGPAGFDLFAGTVTTIKQNMLLRREDLQATLVQNAAVYPVANVVDVSTVATDQFDDPASDPLAFLSGYIEETFPNAVGKRPNTFWMGQQVWTKLIQNAKIRTQIYGTTGPNTLPTAAQIAGLFGVDRILVGRAVSKTAAGATTRVWGKKAGLVFVPPVAGVNIPAFGYTVEETVFNGAAEAIVREFDNKMGPAGGWWVKRGSFYTPAVTFSDSGILFENVVT